MNDLHDIATTYRIFSCDGEDSNLRSPAYETGKMTTSLPRNISFQQRKYTNIILFIQIFPLKFYMD